MIKQLFKIVFLIPLFFFTSNTASAAGCLGNIVDGTLPTSTGGIIYLSDAAWDAANPTDLSDGPFNTYYDTANLSAPFSGQAWSADYGWLDFDGLSATFRDPTNSPLLWGGWTGALDLTPITLTGTSFSGSSISADLTGGDSNDTDDWWVGAGIINFDEAILTGTSGSGCAAGVVDLFVENVPSYIETGTGSCPLTSVDLTWTSTDVSGCTTGSTWNSPGTRANQELSGEATSVNIADGDTETFTLTCIEDGTLNPITATATASCSDSVIPPSSSPVNLYVNGVTNYLETSSCPLNVVDLTWDSTGVSNCTTSGPWSSPGTRPSNNSSGESTLTNIADGDTEWFSILCVSDATSAAVSSHASASCSVNVPINPWPPISPGVVVPTGYINT